MKQSQKLEQTESQQLDLPEKAEVVIRPGGLIEPTVSVEPLETVVQVKETVAQVKGNVAIIKSIENIGNAEEGLNINDMLLPFEQRDVIHQPIINSSDGFNYVHGEPPVSYQSQNFQSFAPVSFMSAQDSSTLQLILQNVENTSRAVNGGFIALRRELQAARHEIEESRREVAIVQRSLNALRNEFRSRGENVQPPQPTTSKSNAIDTLDDFMDVPKKISSEAEFDEAEEMLTARTTEGQVNRKNLVSKTS